MAITSPLPGGNFLTSGPAGLNGRDGRDGATGSNGRDGRDGADGRDGRDGAGTITTRTPRVRILPGSVVVSDGDFYAVPADPFNLAHCGLVLGVTALGGEIDGIVAIQSSGDLDSVSGLFTGGEDLFAADDGTLTRIPPTTGPDRPAWRQSVGKSSSASRMVVNLGPAYRLPSTASILVSPDQTALDTALLANLTPALLARALASAQIIFDGGEES